MDYLSPLSSDVGASVFDFLYERQLCAMRRLSSRLRVVVDTALERVRDVHVAMWSSDEVQRGLVRACPRASSFVEVGTAQLDTFHRQQKHKLVSIHTELLLPHGTKPNAHLKKLLIRHHWSDDITAVLAKFPQLTDLDVRFDGVGADTDIFNFEVLRLCCPLLESFAFASSMQLQPGSVGAVRELANLENLRELRWKQGIPSNSIGDFISVLPTTLRVLNITSGNFTNLEHFELAARRMPHLERMNFSRYLAQTNETHRVLDALPNTIHADFPFDAFRSYRGSLPKVRTLTLSLYQKSHYEQSSPEETLGALEKCPAVEEISMRLLMLPKRFPHTDHLQSLDLLRCDIPHHFAGALANMRKLTDLKMSLCQGALLSNEIIAALTRTSLKRLLIFPQLPRQARLLKVTQVEMLLEHVKLDYLCVDVRKRLESWAEAFPKRMANPVKFLLVNVSRISFGKVYCEESVYIDGKRIAYPCEFQYR